MHKDLFFYVIAIVVSFIVNFIFAYLLMFYTLYIGLFPRFSCLPGDITGLSCVGGVLITNLFGLYLFELLLYFGYLAIENKRKRDRERQK